MNSDFGLWTSAGDPAAYIQKDRDYWTKAPDSTAVTVYPQPGPPSLPDYPTVYPKITSYTPYTYPHPLIAEMGG